jgi:hypothetical protein
MLGTPEESVSAEEAFLGLQMRKDTDAKERGWRVRARHAIAAGEINAWPGELQIAVKSGGEHRRLDGPALLIGDNTRIPQEKFARGTLADRAEIQESAVCSRTFLHFRQFLLRNQEHGKNFKDPNGAGVMTPGLLGLTRPPRA